MKKMLFMVLACAATMTACNNGKTNTETTTDSTDTAVTVAADTLTFKGEGPAADGSYEYCVSIYGADAEKQAALLKVGVTHEGRDTMAMTTGLVNVINKDGKTYYRINEDKTDSLTFLQVDESTLRLVGADFKEPENKALNTDLKLVK